MNPTTITRNLLTTIALSMLVNASFGQAKKCVAFQGTILADSSFTTKLLMKIDGQASEMIAVSGSGKFKVFVPEGSTALLSYSLVEHQNKTLVLDTENAFASNSNSKKNKKVDFDVRLKENSVEDDVNMHLVGRIEFLKGSGLMKVTYDPGPQFMEVEELIAFNQTSDLK